MGQPHVVVFPFPAQGHIKPMLCLAELLCQAGLRVTFLNTHHNHRRLNSLKHIISTRSPTLHFESISDGLPDDHPRNLSLFMELVHSIKTATKPLFRDLLISLSNKDDIPPVSCLVVDGIMSFAIDVAQQLQIKVIVFRTISCCCLWSYLCVPKLSLTDGTAMNQDNQVYCFESKQMEDPNFQFFVSETQAMTRAYAVILNTFDSLEAPFLSQIASLLPKVYTIGPLHALLKSRIEELREADHSCMAWLDSQPLRSVVYVSFGSYVVLTREELLEFWHGLVNSGKRFLWALRQDNDVVIENERGCIVDWAPQEEVLAHRSVGAFITHCGWNSTLESIVVGVPMICWPKLPDQLVNSWCSSEVWKIGLDMKDVCDRSTVEKMVRSLMEGHPREEEIIARVSKLARAGVSHGGSSSKNLELLIQELKAL